MIPIAVRPIAMPISTRRRTGSWIAWRAGEAGCSRSAVKKHAEIMKIPTPAASIKYSGQWVFSASAHPEEVSAVMDAPPNSSLIFVLHAAGRDNTGTGKMVPVRAPHFCPRGDVSSSSQTASREEGAIQQELGCSQRPPGADHRDQRAEK